MADEQRKEDPEDDLNVDKIIEELARLDKLFKDRFQKTITVMFTDLKGSTAIAETHGDIAHRTLIKQHFDIVFPVIKKHDGILVKTMGDGTMSYYENAQSALRAAAEIQKGIDAFNLEKKLTIPILMRIGIHVGLGIVEKNDIFGDVVNVSSRIEAQANPGEILLSEEAYNALSDRAEIYCGFAKEVELKGKKEPMKLYKGYWNKTEIQRDLSARKPVQDVQEKCPLCIKVLLALAGAILLAAAAYWKLGRSGSDEERRTTEHSVTITGDTN